MNIDNEDIYCDVCKNHIKIYDIDSIAFTSKYTAGKVRLVDEISRKVATIHVCNSCTRKIVKQREKNHKIAREKLQTGIFKVGKVKDNAN